MQEMNAGNLQLLTGGCYLSTRLEQESGGDV